MKELVYKTVDGDNPRKKEISIEEIEERCQFLINKKWTCKYFVRSQYMARDQKELDNWLGKTGRLVKNVRDCHIMKSTDTKTGNTKVICKVMGEFIAVNGFNVIRIVYANSLKINMKNKLSMREE